MRLRTLHCPDVKLCFYSNRWLGILVHNCVTEVKNMNNKLFVLALVLSVIAMPAAFAETTDTSIILGNSAPTVGTVTATDPVTLVTATTVIVQCNATVTDLNGYADITGASAKLWKTADGGADNLNDHYTNGTCTLSTGSGTTRDATCSFSVMYSALPGEWTCNVTGTDGTATGSAQKTDITIGSLKALSVGTTMAFGSTALGAIAVENSTTVSNKGNAAINVSLYTYGVSNDDGYSFNCATGTIAFDALKYNLTASQDYTANMSAIGRNSTAPVTDTAFDLAIDDNATPSTKNIYWKVLVPASGVDGTCSGKLVVLAI
jgi:hypothetical protein